MSKNIKINADGTVSPINPKTPSSYAYAPTTQPTQDPKCAYPKICATCLGNGGSFTPLPLSP